MSPELKRNIGFLAAGLVAGLVAGGFIWGGAEPKVETKTVEFERTVQVEVEKVVTITVEKTVVVKEALKADKVTKETITKPNGEVIIREEAFNLGVTKDTQEKYTLQLNENEKSVYKAVETSKTSETSVGMGKKHYLGLYTFVDPRSILSYNYKTDWVIEYKRSLNGSPFSFSLLGGPKLIGVGIGAEF